MRRRGIVLVAVLGIVALLGALAAAIGATSRSESRMCLSEMEAIRAKWAIRAGVEKAIAILVQDDPAIDTLSDIWADSAELKDIGFDGCTLDIEITDEERKLNLNYGTRKMLMELEGMTDELVDCILDWRDRNDETREFGAEAGYYLNLQYPYSIRNGRFRTFGELLAVNGVTRELVYGMPAAAGSPAPEEPWVNSLGIYGYETNSDGEGTRRVNINTRMRWGIANRLDIPMSYARWIVDNRGNGFANIGHLVNDSSPKEPGRGASDGNEAQPLDRQTFIDISDSIRTDTVRIKPGKININTVGKAALVALLEGDRDLADRIMMARDNSLAGFEKVGELLNVEGMTIEKFRSIVDLVTVRSNVFTIRCTVTSERTGAKYTASAVVDRGLTTPRILLWQQ